MTVAELSLAEREMLESFGAQLPPVGRCPQGQGFWKTHLTAWAAGSLQLGAHSYDQGQLVAILKAPVKGDASLILSHQLIAALLNIANGSDEEPIDAAITKGNGLLIGFSGDLPYSVAPSTATGKAMVETARTLAGYNNGQLMPVCAE